MTFNWTRRRIILLAIPPLLFVLYVLIGFFGVPAYVRHTLSSTLAESPQAVDQLDALEQALHKRPAVSLRVTGGLAPDADRLPLKRRKFVMEDVPGEIATDAETAADAPR